MGRVRHPCKQNEKLQFLQIEPNTCLDPSPWHGCPQDLLIIRICYIQDVRVDLNPAREKGVTQFHIGYRIGERNFCTCEFTTLWRSDGLRRVGMKSESVHSQAHTPLKLIGRVVCNISGDRSALVRSVKPGISNDCVCMKSCSFGELEISLKLCSFGHRFRDISCIEIEFARQKIRCVVDVV